MRKWVIKKGNKYWTQCGVDGWTADIQQAKLWLSEKVRLAPNEELVPVEVEIKEVKE